MNTQYTPYQMGLVSLETAHAIRTTDAMARATNDAAFANDDFFDRLDQKRAELLERPYQKRLSGTYDSWSAEADQAAVRATFDEAGADQYTANLLAIRDRKLGELRGV